MGDLSLYLLAKCIEFTIKLRSCSTLLSVFVFYLFL